METGSVLSEPSTGSRGFSTERSVSMTILSPKNGQPRMSHLETLEAKMASIEVSLSSSANTPRRRKGTSLGGGSTISARASPRPSIASDTINVQPNNKQEHRTALQERETIIQNLRLQLGLGKLPRPTGTPLDESERPVAEHRLLKLRNEADSKSNAIRNLKSALEKLDVTDNIDVRIRQAELEYALGREELHLLSLVEEIRALQSRLEKSFKSNDSSSPYALFILIQNGVNLSLHAIQATVGRFGVTVKQDAPGLYVEWAIDGEGLFRGDRMIEANGNVIGVQTKEEFQTLLGTHGRCELVVIRKRSCQQNNQLLVQSQEDNQRLQHRISYLEDQVKELQQSTKEIIAAPALNETANSKSAKGGHVTSISISSTPTSPNNVGKPQIFQRGNFVATIIGGKAVKSSIGVTNLPLTNAHPHHITKTVIHEQNGAARSDTEHDMYYRHKNSLQHSQSQQYIGANNKMSSSASQISINSDKHYTPTSVRYDKGKQRDYNFKENRRVQRDDMDRHSSHPNLLNGDVEKYNRGLIEDQNHQHNGVQERVEISRPSDYQRRYGYQKGRQSSDIRSAKSIDFEKDFKASSVNSAKKTAASVIHRNQREVDYTSEPVSNPLTNLSRPRNGHRPTPPKKPLRLSLQRAQSLQTIEASATAAIMDLDKKRAIKRTHRGSKTPDLPQSIDTGTNSYHSGSQPHLQTSSLGRSKYI